MKIKFLNEKEQSDHTGSVIDIIAETKEEAFQLGVIAEKIWAINGCGWRINGGIRIPLVLMNEIGLAATYKGSEL